MVTEKDVRGTLIVKKRYQPPRVTKYASVRDLPAHLKQPAEELLIEAGTLTTVVDKERRFISVSEGFAKTLGYRIMDLIGRRIDDFTAPGSIDIEFVFGAFRKLGEMDGIWIFQHREGRKVVVHYRARLREDHSFAEIEPLLVA